MKARTILLAIIILIIGFILGMLTSAQMRYRRLDPVRVYFSEERFRDGFYHAIQPDEQQKGKIDVILDKYGRINSELQHNFRRDLDANMKEFRNELDQNLTKDQLERLKNMDNRRQEMIRHYRQNHERDSLDFRRGPHRGRFGRERFHSESDSSDLTDKK